MRTPFLPVPEPVAFTVFGVDIMWYAIMITTGIVMGTLLAYRRAPRYGIDPERVLDMILYCVPASIVGARTYYVIFEWDRYKNDLIQVFNIRGGGMAIHGALIVALALGAYIVRRWKQKPFDWFDLFAPGIALGQAIGRWGNYFNSEAHGGPTDLPWAIYADGEFVHPTFLYESVWCLLLCIALVLYERKHGRSKFSGQIFCLYGFFYSLERYFVEGLRTDSLWIGPFRQAQLISLGTMAACAVLYFVLRKRAEKAPEEPAADENAEEPEAEEQASDEPAEAEESAAEPEESLSVDEPSADEEPAQAEEQQ
ncbi:MAG: prolipoprotein diacylglyceryl transferase [Firmicutes bacterium]|nr:prolipoprotein diacylglyceryl transferase [Bacillota bacterium]